MAIFQSYSGTVTAIQNFWTENTLRAGCNKLMSIQTENGETINFVVTTDTYVVDQEMLDIGDSVTGYYDSMAPTPMIYPPQFRAIIMAKNLPARSIKVDFFGARLISSDGSLQINMGPSVQVRLENGQMFTGNLMNRYLLVIYSWSTMSIPAQTTPERIVVLCRVQ